VGEIHVAGLPFQEARALIAETIQKKLLGVTVSVSMGALRRIHVFLSGDVRMPGMLWVDPLTTAMEALWMGGGVCKKGSLRRIEVRRNGKLLRRLDLYKMLLTGSTKEDVRLAPRDVVFAPPIGPAIAVAGAVARPAIYELKNERTLLDALKFAGGRLADADPERVVISRLLPDGSEKIVDVPVRKAGSFRIRAGDLVFVPRHPQAEDAYVRLSGEVKAPGKRAWHEGMTLGDVLALSMLKPSALRTRVEIVRHRVVDGEKREVRRLEVALDAKGAWKRAPLAPYDVVLVRRMEGWRPDAVVHLEGEFRFPGVYPIEEGERLSSVIARAGGFTDEAYLPAAVFLR
ncbi:MAG: hypothetical protein D6771_08785, partial [Zetaproteobacteria bacterium]